MPFGQSWAARQLTRTIMSAAGAPAELEEVASRAVGWTTAHLTLDHHHQVLAEIADGAQKAATELGPDALAAAFDQYCGDDDGSLGPNDFVVAAQKGLDKLNR